MGTTIPITSQSGTTYRFDLDTIAHGECGMFFISVIVDTSAQVGQTHCSSVNIYPDSICNPSWTGPVIQCTALCNNDTVFFKVENTGSDIIIPQDYAIYENNFIVKIGSVALNAGDSIILPYAANQGNSYRIEVRQATGLPYYIGPNPSHASVEGCNPYSNGSFITGIIPQFYNGHSSPAIAKTCDPNIASYDPNDKTAQPEGFDTLHYILPNTALQYRIRFQNTGNDTAFNIIVVDTLSSNVDISTLQMGASSHDYTWSIHGEGILTVRFANVMLVDSNTNEELSHGFFNYNIHQNSNLANGTIINNRAAIYFDYNEPIITNQTFHTINDNFAPYDLAFKSVEEIESNFKVFPNPGKGLFYVNQKQADELQILVIDNLGRILIEQTSSDILTYIDLSSYPAGFYYVSINNGAICEIQKVLKQ